jgi:GAF domain-containing protein
VPDPQEQVTSALIELADTLVGDYDLLDYLDRLLEHCTGALRTDTGGVMLSDPEAPQTNLKLLASTDEDTRELELFELQTEEGPCLESIRTGEPILVEDLAADSQTWPRFAAMAIGRGYRSVYALPMRLRHTTIGALNLFRTTPVSASSADMPVAQAYADMATIGIMQQRAVAEAQEVASQLKIALHSRVVIEQAKGMTAERMGCEMDEAYQLLRWYGRNRNRRLREVAADVVAGRLTPADLTGPHGNAP